MRGHDHWHIIISSLKKKIKKKKLEYAREGQLYALFLQWQRQ